MKKYFLFFLAMSFVWSSFAQESSSKKKNKSNPNKNSVIIAVGVGLPSGGLAATDKVTNPTKSRTFFDFPIEEGFAKTGVDLKFQYSHSLTKALGFIAMVNVTSHGIEKNKVKNKLNSSFGLGVERYFDIDNNTRWSWAGFSIGPKLTIPFGPVKLGFWGTGGLVFANSPEITVQYITSNSSGGQDLVAYDFKEGSSKIGFFYMLGTDLIINISKKFGIYVGASLLNQELEFNSNTLNFDRTLANGISEEDIDVNEFKQTVSDLMFNVGVVINL